MPSVLAAWLAARDTKILAQVWSRLITTGNVLRGFVQAVRSGVLGRKSFGSAPKRLLQAWLCGASEEALLAAAIGGAPSLADVVKMVHPNPLEPWRSAWFAWLLGRTCDPAALPRKTRSLVAFRAALAAGHPVGALPDVPFQLLTSLPLGTAEWCEIARRGSWQMVRQNLNTFKRHGVFERSEVVSALAARLSDRKEIGRAKVLPYQLLATYKAASEWPRPIMDALHTAMELATEHVTPIASRLVICPDVSGSMSSPVTGVRKGASSKVRCIDVAALVAAAYLRKNPTARVLPFETKVVDLAISGRASILANARALASIGGGGTNCSAPLAMLNRERAIVDTVLFVSDNESWMDPRRGSATTTLYEWNELKRRCPHARMVCIDIQPGVTTQATEREDILNIGGFSDDVFRQIETFLSGASPATWVREIDQISLVA